MSNAYREVKAIDRQTLTWARPTLAGSSVRILSWRSQRLTLVVCSALTVFATLTTKTITQAGISKQHRQHSPLKRPTPSR